MKQGSSNNLQVRHYQMPIGALPKISGQVAFLPTGPEMPPFLSGHTHLDRGETKEGTCHSKGQLGTLCHKELLGAPLDIQGHRYSDPTTPFSH